MSNNDWIDVSQRDPCPLCRKDHWCSRKVEGDAVICRRITETPSGWRRVKRCTDGGTVFAPVKGKTHKKALSPFCESNGRSTTRWTEEAAQYATELTDDRARELSQILGVHTEALKALGIGWRYSDRTYTFAEVDGNRRVVGINRRYRDGSQKAIQGGRRGLVVPEGFENRPGQILIVEGATDVAACLSIGLTAVGRPSNRGGAKHLAQLLVNRDVLVVGELDQKPDGSWPGRDGAVVVAKSLSRKWRKSVRWTLPPHGSKDLRQWLNCRGIDLKDAGARATAGRELFEALEANANTVHAKIRSSDQGGRVKNSQATTLCELVEDAGAELFHDQDREPWATIPVADHKETHRIHTKGFKIWLQGLFYKSQGRAAGSQAVQDALCTIAAKAIYDGPQRSVYVRLAEHKRRVYLDLADDLWRVIEIDSDGWRIIHNPPVRFRRPRGMLPLPDPLPDGSVDELRQFVNVKDDGQFVLLVAFLVQALRPRGPYPILLLSGEQGSAKSTLSRLLRALVDPNTAPLRSVPCEERDLVIACTNSWLICLENLSHIPLWLSDALCRMSTGGGLSTRELYTNDEEILFDIQRPGMINGIGDIVTQPDLLDRCIPLSLPRINKANRLPEAHIWTRFEQLRPRILGALLDAVSMAIRNVRSVRLDELPRLADFGLWIAAAEPALPWKPGTFIEAYAANRNETHEIALEASVLAPVLREWLPTVGDGWVGTASELLKNLTAAAGEAVSRRTGWPKLSNALSGMLRTLAPNLRGVGMPTEFDRVAGSGVKLIRLGSVCSECDDPEQSQPSRTVTPSS